MKRRHAVLVLAAGCVAGCSTPRGSVDRGARRREIDGAVDNALADLYMNIPRARALTDSAQAMLVLPRVITAGLVVGATAGEGALRKGPSTLAYYSVAGGSIGLLAGAQSHALYVLFMTREALDRFQASNGWTAGADASVVVLDAGATARAGSGQPQGAVLAFVRGQQGFMANVSFDGTRFTRLQL